MKGEKESLLVGFANLVSAVPLGEKCWLRFLKYRKRQPKALNAMDGDRDGLQPPRKVCWPCIRGDGYPPFTEPSPSR